MDWEVPDKLLARLRLGREEYCQRLLTTLILDAPYPRWNTQHTVSDRGLQLLRDLDTLCFGSSDLDDSLLFVDEFDLPRRHDDERGGAPDYAVLTSDRLWFIELKTERASHRRGQLRGYVDLGEHHHPGRRIDITYLTGPLAVPAPDLSDRARYAHLTWDEVLPVVRACWKDADERQQHVVSVLEEVVAGLGTPWSQWRKQRMAAASGPPASPTEALRTARDAAESTAADGKQRALDIECANLEELQELRLEVKEALAAHPDPEVRKVRPWLWRTESTGQPLTDAGRSTGYELRVSHYRS